MAPKLEARYGRWVVLDPDSRYRAHDKVPVRCECGVETERPLYKLTSGRSTSCGCYRADRMRVTETAAVDLPHDAEAKPGSRHGRWTALTLPHHDPDHRDRVVVCRCECGVEKTVNVHDLLGRKNQSCGCLKSDLSRARLTNPGGKP